MRVSCDGIRADRKLAKRQEHRREKATRNEGLRFLPTPSLVDDASANGGVLPPSEPL